VARIGTEASGTHELRACLQPGRTKPGAPQDFAPAESASGLIRGGPNRIVEGSQKSWLRIGAAEFSGNSLPGCAMHSSWNGV
jgi:hypothetical protein